jgi:hypothetical protein
VFFAQALGLSKTGIGLTVVAIGTTLPDKAISLIGGVKNQGGLVATAVGSNLVLLKLVLGLSALATLLGVDTATLRFDVPIMLGCSLLRCLLVFRGRAYWRTGVALLLLYASTILCCEMGWSQIIAGRMATESRWLHRAAGAHQAPRRPLTPPGAPDAVGCGADRSPGSPADIA